MSMSAAQRELAGTSIVLIVDDVPRNLEILGSLLSDAGFEISVATSGMQAITAANAAPPALILMDVSMPEMDGYAACERLKANPLTAEIPVIFLTAHSGESEILRGFEAGGVDYVTKPFKTPELLARILTHLELNRSRERIMQQNHELKEMNEKLALSEESLRLANSMKDKFLSILAHDLRNPVSSFYQITDIILTGDYRLDEETKHNFLKLLHESASGLRDLLENLLTWARSQTGRIDFKPYQHHLAPAALESASLIAPNARQKSITIHSEIADDVMAYFDDNMVGTIFRNLISNAIKFTNEGGTITLSAENQGDFLAVSVSDTGIGLTVADLGKLFRIDVPHTSIGTGKEKGTGLGLILCREFAERHGGTIRAKSESKKGSVFTFTLPKSGPA
jgi:two-component system, sensor histidine kinase and response regulator